MATRNKCTCGKVMGKYAHRCHDCDRKHWAHLRADALAVVATGKCPQCGRPLRQNLSITGWWLCSQFGAKQFRADPTQPSCSFQVVVPGEER
jgi:predicted nucleic acid-binding Zn ribbon protein